MAGGGINMDLTKVRRIGDYISLYDLLGKFVPYSRSCRYRIWKQIAVRQPEFVSKYVEFYADRRPYNNSWTPPSPWIKEDYLKDFITIALKSSNSNRFKKGIENFIVSFDPETIKSLKEYELKGLVDNFKKRFGQYHEQK